MKGKGVACARNLEFVLLNYLVKPKTVELKCSSLNGYDFRTAGLISTISSSYEPQRSEFSNDVT